MENLLSIGCCSVPALIGMTLLLNKKKKALQILGGIMVLFSCVITSIFIPIALNNPNGTSEKGFIQQIGQSTELSSAPTLKILADYLYSSILFSVPTSALIFAAIGFLFAVAIILFTRDNPKLYIISTYIGFPIISLFAWLLFVLMELPNPINVFPPILIIYYLPYIGISYITGSTSIITYIIQGLIIGIVPSIFILALFLLISAQYYRTASGIVRDGLDTYRVNIHYTTSQDRENAGWVSQDGCNYAFKLLSLIPCGLLYGLWKYTLALGWNGDITLLGLVLGFSLYFSYLFRKWLGF